MGMPSCSMEKAMAFFAREKSWVKEANLGWSWFSRKDPKSVVSEQVSFI